MKTRNQLFKLSAALLVSAGVLASCTDNENVAGKGKASVYLTDAPIDAENVTGVYISVMGVELNGPNGWVTVSSFEEPKSLNLLDYQNGESYFLADQTMDAGVYSEARLILDITEKSESSRNVTPGCYLEFANGEVQPLFVPSGSQSGYKAKGDFTISANSTTDVIIDFDVRKAVVEAGNSGQYILKPVLRLVSNENIGNINGTINSSLTNYSKVVVFIYENDTFTEAELETTDSSNGFDNAVSSALVNEAGEFTLAFINQGTYDLYFVAYDQEGSSLSLIGEQQDVEVKAQTDTEISLELEISL
ncbi:DUF4382 domain-containing protein [Cytophagales bacterium LB-30]|uniref:DUF4382 domain-containing protein n=2 Tax=Shiella aurantiaca TaxID=3058365 RepID=A0ABT8F520_9BACT|nr:DUF4382 domain-containing protein [Shiella aurantiaca]